MTTRKVNKDVKRESSREDEPMVRVQRQREMVEAMKHENEVLRLELTREGRDAMKATSSSGAADIQRLQDEAARYLKKIEKERRVPKCPRCECDAPTIWPFSGCDVTCGAKCGDICCCMGTLNCPRF